MSEKRINITESVMRAIEQNNIQMRPKWFFIVGALLAGVGIVGSIVSSIFLLALANFSWRTHGHMGQYRVEQILSTLPWWAPILAILSLLAGGLLLKRYEFSYKRNLAAIVLALLGAVIIAVLALDYLGFNDALFRHGPMRHMMQQYDRKWDSLPEGVSGNGHQMHNGWE